MRCVSVFFAMALLIAEVAAAGTVKVWPAPVGEELSPAYSVAVEGQDSPVYIARVAPEQPARRWKAMDDKANSADYYENAAFTTFEMQGAAEVVVTCSTPVTTARILPSSLRIVPRVDGHRIMITMTEPRPLTIEVNGDWVHSLHILANPPERDPPQKGDENVIYFGPGVHEVTHVKVGSGKTVYVAGGAIVRGVIGPEEPHGISSYSGLKTYSPTFQLHGKNITVRGRGIIDGSRSSTHARNLMRVQGSDIRIEGVIFRDSSTWNIPIRRCDRVAVRNVKILGYRANSDGIDICNSRDVTVEDCFIRTLDDLIVVKTDRGAGMAQRIVARNCVLWNEVAHALSVGAELREDVDDVLFTDCDIIHDKGREWTLRIYHCDSARISNVRFENLRIEESRRLISLWINKAFWTRDEQRGHIDDVIFRNIAASTSAVIELKGFDAEHAIENVLFKNVTLGGEPLKAADIRANEFVRGVSVVSQEDE
jgi:hypothetical protein